MSKKILEGKGFKYSDLSDDYDLKIWGDCLLCRKEFYGWGFLCPKCEKKVVAKSFSVTKKQMIKKSKKKSL